MLKVKNAPFTHKDHIYRYIHDIICGGPDEEGLFGEEEERPQVRDV